MNSTSFFGSTESQKRWRLHMNYKYSTETPGIRPCVFQVPDNLRETKPEAYIPQILGLGPYHHFRPQVQHMSTKKRDAVHNFLETVKSSNKGKTAIQNYEDFIRSIETSSEEFHYNIRSCYDRFLDLDSQTLAWVVVVDSMVLWHFIVSSSEEEKLVADIFMLENQIPCILMVETRKVLGLTFNNASDAELRSEYYYFCAKHSPLKLTSDSDAKQAAFQMNNHILHFMYQLIMRTEGFSNEEDDSPTSEEEPEPRSGDGHRFKVLPNVATDYAAEIYYHVVEEFNSAMEKAETAGLKVTGNIRMVSQLLQKVERTLQLGQYYNKFHVFSGDKIEIPSVSRLVLVLNVQFKPLPDGHGIRNIKFGKTEDGKALEFWLPVIEMRPNSEVIIRNLVAYEATMSDHQLPEGSSRLREFVDLMCGLIKSKKDVQLLKDAGIIKVNGQLQNQQIVDMCSGISKSDAEPNDDSEVGSTVKDANDHFNKTRFVKFWRGFMKAVSTVVMIFRALCPFFIVLFLGFQSACQIFDCRVGHNRVAAANLYLDDPRAKALMLPRKLLPY